MNRDEMIRIIGDEIEDALAAYASGEIQSVSRIILRATKVADAILGAARPAPNGDPK